MQRIVRGRSATLTHTFYSDGLPSDPSPDTTTVTVTRSDGTALYADEATTNTGAGTCSFTLTPTDTSLLDTLTVTWSATFDSHLQTFVDLVEIAGGVLFTIAQARAIKPLDNAASYPTPDLLDMRTTVEDSIEDYCGALVPRYAYETVQARYGRPLRLGHPSVRAVRSITLNGTDLSPTEVANITTDGTFLHGCSWLTGPVTVGYEHGRDRPPERLRRAALLLAKVWLIAGPVDDRTNTFTSTEGGTYSLVTAGRGGSIFGVPEVDAAVQANRLTAVG
jgi:hypothetical protein